MNVIRLHANTTQHVSTNQMASYVTAARVDLDQCVNPIQITVLKG